MINILFLCVANSARSQMAEGIGQKVLQDMAQVSSAGSHPSKIHPMSIQVLKEIDIDISHHKSKSMDSINKDKIDLVITLCAEEICPLFPGNVKRLHWPLLDPVNLKYRQDEQLILFRKVRDELKNKIQMLKKEIQLWKK
jgi:arsenate reductase